MNAQVWSLLSLFSEQITHLTALSSFSRQTHVLSDMKRPLYIIYIISPQLHHVT